MPKTLLVDAAMLDSLIKSVPALSIVLYCYLATHDPTTTAALARALNVSYPTIRVHLETLENAGLITPPSPRRVLEIKE